QEMPGAVEMAARLGGIGEGADLDLGKSPPGGAFLLAPAYVGKWRGGRRQIPRLSLKRRRRPGGRPFRSDRRPPAIARADTVCDARPGPDRRGQADLGAPGPGI